MDQMINNDAPGTSNRRRKNTPGGRSIVYKIRLSEAEQKALQVKANSAGVTVSHLLVQSALDTNLTLQQRIWNNEIAGLRRQLQQGKWDDDLVRKLIRKLDE